MNRADVVQLALAFVDDEHDVRAQLAEWLAGIDAFALGVAQELLRHNPCPHCKRARGASRATA